eukprot:m.351079 g.351079  ORF g.351079 m.351079 type:complete len:235 (+) comp16166_c0_seq1:146-850(+)
MKTFIVLAALVAVVQAGAFTKLIQCTTDLAELATTLADCPDVAIIAAASGGVSFAIDNSTADIKASVNSYMGDICQDECIGQYDKAQAEFFTNSDCESLFGANIAYTSTINSVGFACTQNSNGDYCLGAQAIAYQYFQEVVDAATVCPLLFDYNECVGTVINRNRYLINEGLTVGITIEEYNAQIDALIAACNEENVDLEPATQESATAPYSSSSVAQVGVVALVASAVAALVL